MERMYKCVVKWLTLQTCALLTRVKRHAMVSAREPQKHNRARCKLFFYKHTVFWWRDGNRKSMKFSDIPLGSWTNSVQGKASPWSCPMASSNLEHGKRTYLSRNDLFFRASGCGESKDDCHEDDDDFDEETEHVGDTNDLFLPSIDSSVLRNFRPLRIFSSRPVSENLEPRRAK